MLANLGSQVFTEPSQLPVMIVLNSGENSTHFTALSWQPRILSWEEFTSMILTALSSPPDRTRL